MVKVTITLPRLPAGAASNLLGLFGLVAVVVAIGGLTNIWWAILAGGAFAVVLAALAQLGEQTASAASPAAATARLRPTPAASEAAKAS